MFCPQCGQQQVTGVIRFCSRCGFPLDGVVQLLNNGGLLPVLRDPDEPVPVSPRRKGVKQGGLLFLSGAVIVPPPFVESAQLLLLSTNTPHEEVNAAVPPTEIAPCIIGSRA